MPSQDMIHADTAMCLTNLAVFSLRYGLEVSINNPKGCLIHFARNDAVSNALEEGVDHVLFIDSDMTFPNYTLSRLLQHNRDIVGCAYSTRREPYEVLIYPCSGSEIDDKGLLESSHLPGGMILIKSSVFKSIEFPWFHTPLMDDGRSFQGEDIYFCEKATKAGFKIYTDLPLSKEIGHIGQKICKIN